MKRLDLGQAAGRVVGHDLGPADQVEVLRALGCDSLQGFPVVAPMPEDAFLAWAEAQDCDRSLAHDVYASAPVTMRA